MRLEGASALVTGAASGLGESTARRLAAAGAHVVIVDRDAGGEAVAESLGGSFAAGSVTDSAAVQRAVDTASAAGPLRVAVNCAGIGASGRIVDRAGRPHDYDAFRLAIDVNLGGTFNVLRVAAAAMAATEPTESGERGVVVNTASIAGYEGQAGAVAYATSKAGVIGMTLAAARDLATHAVRVVTVAPGLFSTPLVSTVPEPTRDVLTDQIAFPPRFGHPDEFADLVMAIVANPYLNGETIRLDAGLRMTKK
ncbi:SDR family NAD(P)-dependent oxidoreductase [Tsukamurella soli]|uniref:SDR family NAD(P)-dependent oxidoreductase n=1 Tax=Tsukamurella soli TaxID=644556 RepID=A0ABP8JSD0_9ACTN